MARIKLSEEPKVRYTLSEYSLFDSLVQRGRGRKITSSEIAEARRKLGPWNATNPLNVVTVTMNRLIDKVEANKESFRICKDGKYPGHPVVEYWLEDRKRSGAKA